MGIVAQYKAFLDSEDNIDPIVEEPPVNDDPADLALLFGPVTQRLREGAGNWAIRVEFNLTATQVQTARALWRAEVAERAEDVEV